MTDSEKKTLIIAGSVAVIGIAVWLFRNGSLVPPGSAGVQQAPPPFPGPNYMTYNVPPYGGQGNSTLYPSQLFPANSNGCGCDECFTAGQNNTGNAPTSLAQLLNLYNSTVPGFADKFAATIEPFSAPPSTIAEQLGAPVANGTF